MIHLFTSDIEKWLKSIEALHEHGGKWTVAASVYSVRTFAYGVRVGCRAAAWLPLGRELVVYDEHREVVPGTVEFQAADRDFTAAVQRVESFAQKHGIRFVPSLLDWSPGLEKKGGEK